MIDGELAAIKFVLSNLISVYKYSKNKEAICEKVKNLLVPLDDEDLVDLRTELLRLEQLDKAAIPILKYLAEKKDQKLQHDIVEIISGIHDISVDTYGILKQIYLNSSATRTTEMIVNRLVGGLLEKFETQEIQIVHTAIKNDLHHIHDGQRSFAKHISEKMSDTQVFKAIEDEVSPSEQIAAFHRHEQLRANSIKSLMQSADMEFFKAWKTQLHSSHVAVSIEFAQELKILAEEICSHPKLRPEIRQQALNIIMELFESARALHAADAVFPDMVKDLRQYVSQLKMKDG